MFSQTGMAIPNHFIQELLNRVDIVDVVDSAVPLRKAGANYVACCPFHGEKTPSFTVSPTKQFYHCFGCGAHGTAIGFLMEYQGLGFVEAVEDLAKRVGVAVPQEARDAPRTPRAAPDSYETMRQASIFYRAELKKSEHAIAYLKGRGLSGEVAARFQIGYAPAGWQGLREIFPDYDAELLAALGLTIRSEEGRVYDRFRDRVMFPIHDQRGQVIGFGGRVLGGEGNDGPKYLNSPETALFQKGQELYGLFLARQGIRASGCVLVVEGYMDVVALAQHGIEYAVATLGTATTPQHIAKLMRQADDIVFCFDGDAAGRKAAWRAAMNALPAVADGLKLSFLFLPAEHDPDSYVREFGREGFEQALSGAITLSAYIIRELTGRHDLATQEGRVRFLEDAKPILQEIRAPGINLMLRKDVSRLAKIEQSEVESLLKLESPATKAKTEPKVPRPSPALTRELLKLLVFRPALAGQIESAMLPDALPGREVLLHAIDSVANGSAVSSAGLLEALKPMVSEKVGKHLAEELMAFDEQAFDIEKEFFALVGRLMEMKRDNDIASVLKNNKPYSMLTDEEKALLQNYWRSSALKKK